VTVNTIGLSMSASSQTVLRINLLHKCELPEFKVGCSQCMTPLMPNTHLVCCGSRADPASEACTCIVVYSFVCFDMHAETSLLACHAVIPGLRACFCGGLCKATEDQHSQIPAVPPVLIPWRQWPEAICRPTPCRLLVGCLHSRNAIATALHDCACGGVCWPSLYMS
jgi:hypothetical protein